MHTKPGNTPTKPLASGSPSWSMADGALEHDSLEHEATTGTNAGGARLGADTVRMPGPPEGRVVRPALAILYRLAVGPRADHYVARFLAFEHAQRGWLGWSWPAFAIGPAWAAYRRLWLAAFAFALLPLLAALGFVTFGATFGRALWLWEAGALLVVWALPSAIAGACANYFFYRRVRRGALAAERGTSGPIQAAARLNTGRTTSWLGAIVGMVGMGVIYFAVVIDLTDAHRTHVVRRHVLESLAAVRILEQQVEANWTTARLVPQQTDVVSPGDARSPIEDIHVDPATGRVRVLFGSKVPELDGKSLLLAPTRDERQQVRWLCVAVGIDEAYLPAECRRP